MTDYSALRFAGKLTGTIKAATALHKLRVEARRTIKMTAPKFTTIPLGDGDERTVTAWAHRENGRIRNWIGASASSGFPHRMLVYPRWIDDQDCGRYSRGCTYTRHEYAPTMLSRGRATVGHLAANIDGKRYRYTAPNGWEYGTDWLGIYIRRSKETREQYRYHLDSDNVRGGLAAMRQAGIEHEAAQRAAAAQKRSGVATRKADAARLRGVEIWVGIEDSRAVGNCRAGTVAWAIRQGLDHGCHHRASVIERVARSHSTVGAVIDAARRRTLADLARGFCNV